MELKLTIDRIEEKKIVLIAETGQEVVINQDLISFEIKEGDVLYLNLGKDKKEYQEKEKMAKDLLNQILTKNDG
jgi:5-keto 4-deoxyuronate isomerase